MNRSAEETIAALDLHPPALRWVDDHVEVIDQRKLPFERELLQLRDVDEVVAAIQTLAVRGAVTIGAVGALGVAAALHAELPSNLEACRERLLAVAEGIACARPTAVNLSRAVYRVRDIGLSETSPGAMRAAVLSAAQRLLDEEIAATVAIGVHGQELLGGVRHVLTHCNTGRLATPGLGTGLAPIYVAHSRGQQLSVLASETRPLGQGARLTAWELIDAGIPVRVMPDGAGAWAMRRGMVDVVLVGADRIAANGDSANKIGTLAHACAAHRHGVPFYVLAPSSTIDLSISDGSEIEIEERHGDELRRTRDVPLTPPQVETFNPAFDVTPGELISAIVTERQILWPPFELTAADLGID